MPRESGTEPTASETGLGFSSVCSNHPGANLTVVPVLGAGLIVPKQLGKS